VHGDQAAKRHAAHRRVGQSRAIEHQVDLPHEHLEARRRVVRASTGGFARKGERDHAASLGQGVHRGRNPLPASLDAG